MMIVREITRRPLRTALSALGLAATVALIILGHFGSDSLNNYLEAMYRREQRQDLTVTFARPAAPDVIGQLARMPGVVTAEGVRAVPIRVRYGHRMRDSILMGFPKASSLRRLVARGGHEVPIPEGAVLLSAKLGEILGLQIGDRPDIELREGERPTVRPVVAGFVDESVGLQIYSRDELVSELEGDLGAVSQAVLRVDPLQMASVEEHLRKSPDIIDVSDVAADVQRLRDMNGAAMDIWTAVSISLAASVIFGVVYNNARIALALRSRDLATLRVIGFSRSEISSVLLGGLAIEVLLAIPLGLWFGKNWSEFFFSQIDQETFRFQVLIEGRTYLLAVVVTLLAAAASAFWVRRSLDRLDLIGVLKTRE
jgi:putative ABC transport system permease protein